MTLRDLQMGESAVITTVGGRGALRQHFLDMGMIPGVQVTLVKYAPMGDPMELRLHGYELTLRLADAEQIEIEEVQKAGAEQSRFTGRLILWKAENITKKRRSIRFRMGQH